MSNSVPKLCANPDCNETTIKPIHRTLHRAAIDAVDGPGVYTELVTYRCAHCGHTWGVSGYATEETNLPASTREAAMNPDPPRTRGW